MASAIDPKKGKVKSASIGRANATPATAPTKPAETKAKPEALAESSFGSQARSNALVPQAPEPGAGAEHVGSLDLGGSKPAHRTYVFEAGPFVQTLHLVGHVVIGPRGSRHEFGPPLKVVEDGGTLFVRKLKDSNAWVQDLITKVRDACHKPGSSVTIPGASRPLVPGEGAEVEIED